MSLSLSTSHHQTLGDQEKNLTWNTVKEISSQEIKDDDLLEVNGQKLDNDQRHSETGIWIYYVF